MQTSSLCQAYFVIFMIALMASLCFQGSRGLYDRDETRYSECAREMLAAGSWLIPLRDSRPHLTKPPLAYWAIAAGLRAFGINEWGARIPNAVAFSVTVLLVGLIGERLFGEKCGLWASMVYLTSIVPFAASNIVTTDTILVMWETAAIWAFINGFKAKTRDMARTWFVITGFLWGLAFLTKGSAIFPVAAAMGIFWFLKRRSFKAFPAGFPVICVFIITGLSWYLVILQKYPWAMDLIIKEQVTGRLFYDLFHRNSAWYAPFYIYLPMVLFGSLPWTISLLAVFKRSIDNKILRERLRDIKIIIFQDDGWLFIFLWWAVPLLVFSLARSRLPLYILPVFPPMAIATARILFKKNLPVFVLTRRISITLAFFLTLKAIAAAVPAPQDARARYRAFSEYIDNADDIDAIGGPFLDGLAFYSGKPVEYLSDSLMHSSMPIDSSWGEELQEIREGKKEIFVLDLGKKGRLALMKESGLKVELLGRFYMYGIFKVLPGED